VRCSNCCCSQVGVGSGHLHEFKTPLTTGITKTIVGIKLLGMIDNI
jgi:hypothetical protein